MITGDNMQYNVVLDTLQNLINYRPTQQQIADIIGVGQTAIAGRAKRNSEFSDEEIEKIKEKIDNEYIQPQQLSRDTIIAYVALGIIVFILLLYFIGYLLGIVK